MCIIKQICYGKGVSGPVCPLSISGIIEFRLNFCTGTLHSKCQTHFHFGLYQSNINPTLYTRVLWSFSETQLTLKSTTSMSNNFESDIYLIKYEITAVGDLPHSPCDTPLSAKVGINSADKPLSAKVGINSADKRWSLGWYSSLAD
jgi:hypothetical protein